MIIEYRESIENTLRNHIKSYFIDNVEVSIQTNLRVGIITSSKGPDIQGFFYAEIEINFIFPVVLTSLIL